MGTIEMPSVIWNATNTTTSRFRSLEELNAERAERRLPASIFLCILIVLGVLGNGTALLIYSRKYEPSTFRFYVITLAVVDLLSCCIAIPVEVVDNLYPLMFYSEEWCKIGKLLGNIFKISSAFILLVIAVDRYRKICLPFSKQTSIEHARNHCIIALIVAFLMSWPYAIIQGTMIRNFEGGVVGYDCTVDDDVLKTLYPFIYATILFVTYIIVFVALVTLYVIIIIYVQTYAMRKAKVKVNPRITRIMIAITVAFIVTYLPDSVLDANSTFTNGNTLPDSALVLGTLPLLARAYFINNVINPVIYFFGDSKFRQIIKLTFRGLYFRMCKNIANVKLNTSSLSVLDNEQH